MYEIAAVTSSRKGIEDLRADLNFCCLKRMPPCQKNVNTLKSMAARAQAFSIRDKQLEEKKGLEAIEAEIDRRQDIMMEIDRVKDIWGKQQGYIYKQTQIQENKGI